MKKVATEAIGYQNLKDKQREVIVNFVKGNDVFAVLPTSYGKGLCYTCLPIVYDCLLGTEGSIVLVVTPLIAIIKDQVTYITGLLFYVLDFFIVHLLKKTVPSRAPVQVLRIRFLRFFFL